MQEMGTHIAIEDNPTLNEDEKELILDVRNTIRIFRDYELITATIPSNMFLYIDGSFPIEQIATKKSEEEKNKVAIVSFQVANDSGVPPSEQAFAILTQVVREEFKGVTAIEKIEMRVYIECWEEISAILQGLNEISINTLHLIYDDPIDDETAEILKNGFDRLCVHTLRIDPSLCTLAPETIKNLFGAINLKRLELTEEKDYQSYESPIPWDEKDNRNLSAREIATLTMGIKETSIQT